MSPTSTLITTDGLACLLGIEKKHREQMGGKR